MVLMFCCSAYGDDVIQKRDQMVARAGNLDSLLIIKLFSTMESDIKELKEQQTKYEEENSKLRKEILEQHNKHEKEISELKGRLEAQPKAVLAQVQFLEQRQLSAGERVKFTGTVSNVGEAYNAAQGYFAAPYDGTYLFTVSLCMVGGNYVEFHIVQDGTVRGEGFSGDTEWFTCPSSTVVTYMNTGSKVWVEIDRVHGGSVSKGHGISSFTAVFLNHFQNS